MIYDIIDTSLITIGEKKEFTNDSNKYLVPIYYNDTDLVFTLKNTFFKIDIIQENNYKKQYVLLKSQKLLNEIIKVCEKFNIKPITEVRATISNNTLIKNTKGDILTPEHLAGSDILAAVVIPTYYVDTNNSYLQIQLKEGIIIKESEELHIQYDISSLKEAI